MRKNVDENAKDILMLKEERAGEPFFHCTHAHAHMRGTHAHAHAHVRTRALYSHACARACTPQGATRWSRQSAARRRWSCRR